jgi:hypothetical protein
MFASLAEDVKREHGLAAWMRSRSTGARVAVLAGAASAIVLVAFAAFTRPDLAVYPVGRMAGVAAVAGLGLVASLLFSLRPTHEPAPPSWAVPWVAALGLGGLAAVYVLPALPAIDPAHVQAPGFAAVLQRAAPCLGIGLVITLSLVALWALLDRGGARRGLAAAAAAGLTANLALQLHCPVTAPGHLLVGHLGAALVILGVAVASRK